MTEGRWRRRCHGRMKLGAVFLDPEDKCPLRFRQTARLTKRGTTKRCGNSARSFVHVTIDADLFDEDTASGLHAISTRDEEEHSAAIPGEVDFSWLHQNDRAIRRDVVLAARATLGFENFGFQVAEPDLLTDGCLSSSFKTLMEKYVHHLISLVDDHVWAGHWITLKLYFCQSKNAHRELRCKFLVIFNNLYKFYSFA